MRRAIQRCGNGHDREDFDYDAVPRTRVGSPDAAAMRGVVDGSVERKEGRRWGGHCFGDSGRDRWADETFFTAPEYR